MTTPALDCRACGACCLGGYDDGNGWATVTEADAARMSRRVIDQLVNIRLGPVFQGDSRSLATPTILTEEFGTMCTFLRGTPGRRVSCRIYNSRPDVCRNYKPGSRSCRDARRQIGLE